MSLKTMSAKSFLNRLVLLFTFAIVATAIIFIYTDQPLPAEEKERIAAMATLLEQEAEVDDFLLLESGYCARVVNKGYGGFSGNPYIHYHIKLLVYETNPGDAAAYVIKLIKKDDPDYEAAKEAYSNYSILRE